MNIWLSFLISFVVTAGGIYLLTPLAIRIGLVDSPRGRKRHKGHVPLIGGIAIFLGFLFALLTLSVSLQPYRGFLAGCALLVFIGVLDDFHELSPRARFVAQTIAALLMVAWGNIELHSFGNLFFMGDIGLGKWGFPITLIAVIAIINAVNMTDGVDGLAGGLALIELTFLLFLAYQGNLTTEVEVLAVFIASLLAFLVFNFPLLRKHALIFMGDAGSMLLGFALVWFLVDLSQGQHKVASPVTMLWIITVPLFDIVGVMLRRMQKRRSLFSPDREHLHHLLQEIGFSTKQVSLVICLAAFICGLIGIGLAHFHVSESVMFLSFLGLFALYLLLLGSLRKRVGG